MNYIEVATLAYPITEQEVREAYPEMFLGRVLAGEVEIVYLPDDRFAPVFDTLPPDSSEITHTLTEGAPKFVEGAWRQTWQLLDRPIAEVRGLLMTQVQERVQSRLDSFFQQRGYDGVLSAATYATSSVEKFRVEGQYAVDARDSHWAKCYEILAAVDAGDRPVPTVDQVESEMPALEWPQ